jgi:hypothetical protein
VIPAQRLHAQERGPGEVADRHSGVHGNRVKSPPGAESSGARALDSPGPGAATVEVSSPRTSEGHPS